jgi:hypothetical protein
LVLGCTARFLGTSGQEESRGDLELLAGLGFGRGITPTRRRTCHLALENLPPLSLSCGLCITRDGSAKHGLTVRWSSAPPRAIVVEGGWLLAVEPLMEVLD